MGQWHLYRGSWHVARTWVREASGPIKLLAALGSSLFLVVTWLLITALHLPLIALRLLWMAGGLGSLAVLTEPDRYRYDGGRTHSAP